MKSTYTTRYGDEVTISRPTYDIQKDLDELVDYYMPPLERDMESLQDRPTVRDLIEPTELRNKFYNIYVRMSQWLINSFYAKIRVKDFSIKKASGKYIIPEFECFIDTSETPIKGGYLKKPSPDHKTNFLKIGFNLVYKERQSVLAKVEYNFTHNCYMEYIPWNISYYLQYILGPYYRAVKDKQKSELEIAEIYKKTRSDICDLFFQNITSAVLTYDSSQAQMPLIIYIIRAAYSPTSLYFDRKMTNTHSKLAKDTDYMPFIPKEARHQNSSYSDLFFEDFTKKGSIVFSKSMESLKSGCEMTTFEMTSTYSFKATLREPSICWTRYVQGDVSKFIYYYIPVFLSNTARSFFWERYENRYRKNIRLGFFLDDGSGDFIKNIKTERYKKEMIDIHLPMVEKDIYIEVLCSSEQGDKKDILANLGDNYDAMSLLKALGMCNENINLASFFEQSEKFEKETQKKDPTYSYFGHGFTVLKNLYPKTERSSIHLKYRKIRISEIGFVRAGTLKSKDKKSMKTLQKEIVHFLSNN